MNSEIKTAIRNDNRTVGEILEEIAEVKTDEDGEPKRDANGNKKYSPSRSYVNRTLNEMLEDDVLVREKDGRQWVYYMAEEKAREEENGDWYGTGEANQPGSPPQPGKQEALSDAATTSAPQQATQGPQGPAQAGVPSDFSEASNMPVNRDYDFESEIQEGVPDYIPSGDELAEMLADIKLRKESGDLPRFLIGGPTGCGKTHLAKYLSQHLDAPMFTIQGKWALNEAHLLGRPVMVGDTSYWVDGPLTKAVIASQDQPVIVLLDEINRARPDSKGVLYPALDDRARIDLEMRGGEVIKGNPMNLIVIGTVNEGSGYFNEKMDLAEIRRLSTKHNVDYLGRTHPEREAKLVAERTPASKNIAMMMVECANLVRIMAEKPNNIEIGVPTSNVMSWARKSYAYSEQDLPNPIFRAAKACILRPFYDDDPDAYSTVETTISDHFDGAPFGEDEFEKWKGKSVESHIEDLREEREAEEDDMATTL